MQATTVERNTMAKKKAGRPKTSDRDDVAVKVARATVNKARRVAEHKGITLAELLTELLQGPVDRAYLQMLRELGEAQ
jgi:hypothetical protein